MRRPSLGHNNSDDLSRLTNGSSTTSTNSSLKLQQQQATTTTTTTNNNNGTHIVPSYLPNILSASEWQNGRKRKERQDSTSSTTQDRKLVRSNSEEQLSNVSESDGFRRVQSHEDFNKKPSPLHLHNNENIITEETQSSVQKLNEIKNELNKENGGKQIPKSPKLIKNECNNTRHSPNRDTKNHSKRHEHDEDEHERRRSNERFCRARVSSGRKSVSPRKAFKYSPIMPTRYQHQTEPVLQFGGRGFGEDDEKIVKSKLTVERIEDVAATDPNIQKNEDSMDQSDASIAIEMLVGNKTVKKVEPKPWILSNDDSDMPVVCQRFDKDTFSHVNNDSMKAFIKFHHVLPQSSTERKSSKYDAIAIEEEKEVMPSLFLTPDERIKQINKKLVSLKKKVTSFEENFERENGYRPSQADKIHDRIVKHATVEIQKLRKEKAQIRSDPITAMGYRTVSDAGVPKEKKLDKLKETLSDIQKRLNEKRSEDNRSEKIEDLSYDELIDEKTAIQRGLLYLESLFGRPNSREERDAARPLYDRYRAIKRLVNRNNSLSNSGGGELPTILEHEPLAFTTGTITPSNDISPPTDVQSPPSESSTSVSCPESEINSTDTTDAIGTINETIKSMSIDKLWIQLDAVREEKKQLRRSIKEFEYQFEETNGRKMLKSDRKAMEETYALYKQKKAKLRLLDALVKKQMNN